jgi:hypothetical protein
MIRRALGVLRVLAPASVVLLVSGASSEQVQPIPETPVASFEELGALQPTVQRRTARTQPTLKPESLLPERPAHAGVQENLFAGHQWYRPPPPRPTSQRVVAPVRREPTAPTMPYELLGVYEQAGNEPLYLLVRNDRIYEVSIGDTLEDTYSVDGVSNGQLMLTYLPLKTSQGIRLGEKK